MHGDAYASLGTERWPDSRQDTTRIRPVCLGSKECAQLIKANYHRKNLDHVVTSASFRTNLVVVQHLTAWTDGLTNFPLNVPCDGRMLVGMLNLAVGLWLLSLAYLYNTWKCLKRVWRRLILFHLCGAGFWWKKFDLYDPECLGAKALFCVSNRDGRKALLLDLQ